MPLIEASHLYRAFGENYAVQDVSLEVRRGEIYGLVGPDGAGKTTTIRLLCGALKTSPAPGVDQPQVRIAGFDLSKQVEAARIQIGYLPQRFSLYEDLTVLENLRFFAEVRGLRSADWRPRCLEILKFVGLDDYLDRRTGYLSGGMKQKLGLAAALVHRPRVLLLDEPTTGVDPVTRQDFWQLIIRLVSDLDENQSQGEDASDDSAGAAVLVSTPYMDEAARCSRIGFMSGGSIIRAGTPNEIRSYLKGRVLELTGSPLELLRRVVSAEPGVQDVQMFGDRLHLRVGPGKAKKISQRLTSLIPEAGGELKRIRQVSPQLEDVFMSLLETQE
jgi:ABC-2 type transport system ATP-binding protein